MLVFVSLAVTLLGTAQPGPAAKPSGDRQFDRGSGLVLSSLTSVQIDNLVLLGKVWGFLKYHHPTVTSGELQWDYELFRILPEILAAPDQAAAQTSMIHWIGGLGPVQPCGNSCATGDKDGPRIGHVLTPVPMLALRPEIAWIADEALLGKELARALQYLQQNRTAGKQFYISLAPGIGNPSFDHERDYVGVKFPDAGFQILALYRFWNIIEYWSPNRNIVGEDWDGVLREFLPRLALAKSSEEYQLEMMELIAQVHDTHANLWSSLSLRPPVGECRLPLSLRFLGQSAVITAVASQDLSAVGGFKVGDVLTDLDGKPVENLLQSWSPYYADSNDAARLRDIARAMTNGPCGPVTVRIRRGPDLLTVATKRLPSAGMTAITNTHDLPGDTFRLLSDQVAYLKLSSVKAGDAVSYIQRARDTKGLIVDIRNYPSEFVVFALGSRLVKWSTPFVEFTQAELSNPGAFHWTKGPLLQPAEPHYSGKVIILVDEVTQSQAEYTAMAFRSSPHAMVIGSTTAGADGDVSKLSLPGGLRTMISGIGIFYPYGKQTQRVGIIPDKIVVPTIEGIGAGRDEVLEEAVRQILGAETSIETIKALAKPGR
ncbi:Peptidase, S41 family [Acidisarcina polymorpha]|uniref:Peptidase, S41 family n=1 Tax=Acidisarcina polymorpha TaxID=2211140 RepID=A0A2Z5G241_9BACT|nr:Peptidase, S41 family [Acidisarcina polymorpha]